MRWRGARQSGNVEDRRRVSPGMALGGGGTLVIILLAIIFGVNPQTLLTQLGPTTGGGGGGLVLGPSGGRTPSPEEEELAQFVSVVLADTEDVWNEIFAAMGRRYQEPTLVLFADRVHSACGQADSAVGPFYCPADGKVYLDLGFFAELRDRFDAPGDFAQAYVVAHEVGHHVQNLLGISGKVHELRARQSEVDANQMSVRLELQADYFAGVWAHHAQRMRQVLEPGDIEEALQAATAIGDDTLQRQARGYVVPDSFTHGSAAQRLRWFKLGFESGDITAHDPFAVDVP